MHLKRAVWVAVADGLQAAYCGELTRFHSVHPAFACSLQRAAGLARSAKPSHGLGLSGPAVLPKPFMCSFSLQVGAGPGGPALRLTHDSLFLLCALQQRTVVSHCLWSRKKKVINFSVNRVIRVSNL